MARHGLKRGASGRSTRYEPKSFAIEAGQHIGAMQDYGLYRGPDFKPYVVDDVDARRIGIEEGVWNPDADVGA